MVEMGEQIIFNGPLGPMRLMMLCLLCLAPMIRHHVFSLLSNTQEVMEEDQGFATMVDAASSPVALPSPSCLGRAMKRKSLLTSSLIGKKT
jgi:hypothetical protein